jgi:hypothetical protein
MVDQSTTTSKTIIKSTISEKTYPAHKSIAIFLTLQTADNDPSDQ